MLLVSYSEVVRQQLGRRYPGRFPFSDELFVLIWRRETDCAARAPGCQSDSASDSAVLNPKAVGEAAVRRAGIARFGHVTDRLRGVPPRESEHRSSITSLPRDSTVSSAVDSVEAQLKGESLAMNLL